ncbi:hypothetical protein HHL24_23695 [Paraburkholderia sp. RP-4-7]|uniref:YcaO domain-containing protein n=1 Tax=Paraburkholderia polaris TaxID=2728848 RepID=A0A848IL44_9BURK|nr:YcaO-like family protein [Paraburkholderia polaris]NMM00929.1 hypothetical protein [Paraburkholderia polaris]
MQCIVPERSLSLVEAEAKIDAQLRENAVRINLDRFGTPLSSTVATLDSEVFNESCRGCGKGYEDEARVGAKFEAYEHQYSLEYFRAACKLMPFQKVATQPALAEILPVRILARSNPTQLGTIQFYDDEFLPLHYPAFLIDYNYPSNKPTGDDADYHSSKRYSCGTGLAAGVGYIEAAIHAVSEVIERHSVGRFIAQHFFYSSEQAVRVVSPDSLPDDVAQVFHDAESCLHSKIQLIDVTSTIDCPVYIARCQERNIAGVHVMGAGCSIYSSHAATRAIKELAQQHHIAEGVDWVRDEWRRHMLHLSPIPRLQQCLVADLDSQQGITMTEVSLPADPPILLLDAQLDLLKNRCKAAGLPIWSKELHTTELGISLACAAMPNMERFSIVSLGNYVVPTYN